MQTDALFDATKSNFDQKVVELGFYKVSIQIMSSIKKIAFFCQKIDSDRLKTDT